MLEAGALDEARALAARKLDPRLPVMKAPACRGSCVISPGKFHSSKQQ
jgi:hypothetical protein